jgi:hypothetical protein
MHSMAPRTGHGVPGAGEPWVEGGDAAPAGSRGELVLRGRHVGIEIAALVGEREGEKGPHLAAFSIVF